MMKKTLSLNQYSIAAVALIGTTAAYSQVAYTDIDPDVVLDEPDEIFGIDLDDDGLNDLFRPLGSGKYVTEYQMTIWNRWGEEVYRDTDAKAGGWDGNYKGKPQPVGVYIYVLRVENNNGEVVTKKGSINLIR